MACNQSRDRDGLTPKQAEFVRQYLIDKNATQAAIRAGYSAKTANEQGARLLANVSVKRAIDNSLTRHANTLEISVDRVLRERSRLAFFDPRKLFNADGSPKSITELDDDTAAALAGLEVMEVYEGIGDDRHFVGYTRKYKLADKGAALTALEKHLGLYEKDNKQRHNLLNDLPREMVKLLVERLRNLNGSPGGNS